MSPVSSSKVSDPAAARVHAPFTLSETRTCSGALYWLNHPTSRSTWATGRVSVTVNAETRDPVENAVPWTKVEEAAVVRGRRAPKVAITAMLAAERVEGNFFTQTPVLYTCDIARARARPGRASSVPGNDQSRGALGCFRPSILYGAPTTQRFCNVAVGQRGRPRGGEARCRVASSNASNRRAGRYLPSLARRISRLTGELRHADGGRPSALPHTRRRLDRAPTSPPAGRPRCAGTPPPRRRGRSRCGRCLGRRARATA